MSSLVQSLSGAAPCGSRLKVPSGRLTPLRHKATSLGLDILAS
jgi:hypothetical protein